MAGHIDLANWGEHERSPVVRTAGRCARRAPRSRRDAWCVDGVVSQHRPHESEALLLGSRPEPGRDGRGLRVQRPHLYHGGNAGSGAIGVEQKPAVYLVYWGPQWAQGFMTADTDGKLYSSKTLQTYLNSFFTNVGGSGWANVQTQYCNGVLAGSTSCVGGTGFVTNPLHQLKGVWTDSTPVPDDIIASGLAQNLVDDPIAQEAIRASAHFKYDAQATYIILTPPSTIATGQPVYCGYHTQTTGVDGIGNPYRIQYAFIPWLNTNWPGLGTSGCGMHNVNATSNAFGNGIFDGWSIVTGHEYSEAVTDPDNISRSNQVTAGTTPRAMRTATSAPG